VSEALGKPMCSWTLEIYRELANVISFEKRDAETLETVFKISVSL
jgi:hypothetical protein